MKEEKRKRSGAFIAAVITLPIGIVIGAVLGMGMGPVVFALMTGGDMPQMAPPEMPPPVVKVKTVEASLLSLPDEFIAAVEALQDVSLRPEVSGRIEAIHFNEGDTVSKGDLLFTIESSKYQAIADAAKADLLRTEKRFNRLKKADPRSIATSDLETAESDYLRSKAAYDLAMVDLKDTKIRAPISGRIGVARVKEGNYVTSGTDDLARIVQLDPIRIVFSQTDREYLAMRRSEMADKTSRLAALVELPDGSMLEQRGIMDFADNTVNPKTGTVAVRYLIDNPDGLLMPGGYVTAKIINQDGERGIKIPQRALLLDQDGAYVLRVDENQTVEIIRVSVGDQVGEDVVISSGLTPGDQIITDGVQKAQPGNPVNVMSE